MDDTQTEELQEAAVDTAALLVGGTLGLIAGLVLAFVVAAVVRLLLRRRPPLRHLVRRGRRPLAASLGVLGLRAGLTIALPAGEPPAWYDVVHHGLTIAFIICLAWLAISLVNGAETAAMESVDESDITQGSRVRRVQTQTQLLSRVLSAVVLTIAVAAVLLTFPGARAFGTSLLASAGIASVVVGLAAQSVLANLFAGLQIAFSDSLRIGDTVIVEGHQGEVEEITLTYIVIKVWDERRLVLPSSYFTTTPFENLTRTDPSMSGTVEIDVDWSVPITAARAEVQRLAAASSDWDGRSANLEVTDTTVGAVRLRVFLTARNNSALWTLRTHMREGLVDWLQRSAPYAVQKSHYMAHATPGAWADIEDEDAAELEAELAELEADGEKISPTDTLDSDLRALHAGRAARPGETRRLHARNARRRADKEDRRRAKLEPGALGRANLTSFQPEPSAATTRLMPGLPPAEELPGAPQGSTLAGEDPYGAVPGDLASPERHSVRSRLAALGRRARDDAPGDGNNPAQGDAVPRTSPYALSAHGDADGGSVRATPETMADLPVDPRPRERHRRREHPQSGEHTGSPQSPQNPQNPEDER